MKLNKIIASLLLGAACMALPMAASAAYAVPKGTAADPGIAAPVLQEKWDEYSEMMVYAYDEKGLKAGQDVYAEYSEDASFPENKTSVVGFYDGKLNMYEFEAGRTYYVRTVLREYDRMNYTVKYSAYSPVISVMRSVPEARIANVQVTQTSVKFTFGRSSDLTGYEISRKIGGKWKVIATVSDAVFTDKGLKSGTTYDYRFRAYVYNEMTKQKVFSDEYVGREVTVWGASMGVKAKAASTTSIKLNWKKVAGAKGYKIYRKVAGTQNMLKVRNENPNFSGYKLVKTIKKANTTTFTNKGLMPGTTYQYVVVSYKAKSSVQMRESSNTVTLKLAAPVVGKYTDGNNNAVFEWDPVAGAEGYIVQRKKWTEAPTYDEEDDYYYGDSEWAEYKKLGKGETTLTLAPYDEKSEEAKTWENQYRIGAYAGNKVYYTEYYVSDGNVSEWEEPDWGSYICANSKETMAAAPKAAGIRATAEADGITVSWDAVPGAAYYEVYRASSLGEYHALENGYINKAINTVLKTTKKEGKLAADGTYAEAPQYTGYITGTSVKDTYLGYTVKYGDTTEVVDVQKGPKAGVRYYYFVRPHTSTGKAIPTGGNAEDYYWDEDYFISNAYMTAPASAMITSAKVAKPAIKSVKSTKKGAATLTWKKVAGAQKYYVYSSAKKGSGYMLSGVTTGTKVTVTGLKRGKKAYFKVVASTANEAGADANSAASAVKSVKVK